MKNGYMPRIADRVLERMLHTTGAVHITGPKGCGKMKRVKTTADLSAYPGQIAGSHYYKSKNNPFYNKFNHQNTYLVESLIMILPFESVVNSKFFC